MEHRNDSEEIIDVEEYARAGRSIPAGRRYRIRIDRDLYVVSVPTMTGSQLLELAGKNPAAQFALYQKLKGGATKKVELDQMVDFTAPGVERFMTLPLDQTEGLQSPRRQFQLPGEDERYLDGLGLPWETVVDGGVQRVVIHDYQLPPGYTHEQVALNIRIEPTYPDTQIDMVYFFPALARKVGQTIGGLSEEPFDGKNWQRWSRHRTSQNPWRPGMDSVETHLALVREWLLQAQKR